MPAEWASGEFLRPVNRGEESLRQLKRSRFRPGKQALAPAPGEAGP